MMKACFSVLIILTILTGTSSAQEITVVTENWPPMNYEKDGKVIGIATEIVKATLDEAGIQASPRIYPWIRAYRMALMNQKNVLIYTIRRTQKREKLFKWICPLVPSHDVFFYKLKKRNDIIINSLEDAKKYTVGEVRGDAGAEYLIKHGFTEPQNLELVRESIQNIKKLFLNRIDLIIDTELSLAYLMHSLGRPFDQLERTFLLYKGGNDVCMAFSNETSDELVERVRVAFEKVKSQGKIESIRKKYLTMLNVK